MKISLIIKNINTVSIIIAISTMFHSKDRDGYIHRLPKRDTSGTKPEPEPEPEPEPKPEPEIPDRRPVIPLTFLGGTHPSWLQYERTMGIHNYIFFYHLYNL